MEFTMKSGKIYDSENNQLCDIIGEFNLSELKENVAQENSETMAISTFENVEFTFKYSSFAKRMDYDTYKSIPAFWDSYTQRRQHRKGRINKKWAKRYGYVLRGD